MKKLLAIPPIHDDEVLYSWMIRIANDNLYCSTVSFYKDMFDIVFPFSRIRTPFELDHISQIISLSDYDTITLIKYHTVEFIEINFISSIQQWKYLKYMVNSHNDSFLKIVPKSSNTAINFCPQCLIEDAKQYGHYYIHREHQIKGNLICFKHNCALIPYSTMNDNILDLNINSLIKMPHYNTSNCPEFYFDYSKFIHYLCSNPKLFTSEDIKKCIRSNILKFIDKTDMSNLIISLYDNSNYKKLLPSEQKKKRIRNCIFQNTVGSFEDYVLILLLIYKDYHIFNADIQPKDSPNNSIEKIDYEIMSKNDSDLITIKHSCGTIFTITPYAFKIGYRCPNCSSMQNEEEKRKQLSTIISNVYGQDYTLDSDYINNISEKMTIKHNKCNKIFYLSFNEFLNGRKCPYCKNVGRPFVKDYFLL